jgi:hypothetical protein
MFTCSNCKKGYDQHNLFPLFCECGSVVHIYEITPLPPVSTQITNFISSSVNHITSGMKTVPNHVKEERLSICNNCPFFKDNRCSKCGCFMNIKTAWAEQSCPEGKWNKYEEDNNSN